jgi:peroxiredoxin
MTLSPADPVEDFTLPDTDGNPVRLAPADADATVVAFTCNHCPYALAWHDRLNDVAREYAPRGVRLLFVNANDATRYPRDSAEAMKARVDRGEFAAPYLHDESQAVARAWGARTTPDIFVVDRDGILAYRGAPDGDHDDPSQRAAWVRDALDAVLDGRRPAHPRTEPVGCSIKWRA